MVKKLALTIAAAAFLGGLGYSAMAFTMLATADTTTVLSFAASDRVPVLPRVFASLRVQSWKGCPAAERDTNALGQTLRGYGLEDFDKQRILATASQLIDIGCDINQRSLSGHAAIHEAILYNEPDVVKFLLAHGADTTLTIEVPNELPLEARSFSGLDPLGFAEALHTSAENREEILHLLRGNKAS